ncbi:energy-coupling factor transport system ATP-binding protein [Anaerosphaera aminiphila DSM 21120]|uniref:Energy-coupling factor transporter ATP-binding protein EcfA2 n=1 Tax=Anaerosphaera aminiphila DSM 21120 TaxID=1120995 RepID=A0A1M5S499_9FIRM|nr:energy-coupling factor transporter ATPase [Anaerosphaera aminiphila]SHH33321.1 energy-coupling factor transport system ATP-binding protein [Anaerosphaera aminiphila DSM 21120]
MSLIEVKNLTHIYGEGTVFEKKALDSVNLTVNERDLIGLIGHTGSGKSTLIQHLNGLIKPTSGEIVVAGKTITDKVPLVDIRQKVGLVFQYPEYQLFEETVERDIAFGPQNLGLNAEEVKIRVKESMELVGLNYDTFKEKSPFELSGGQKRRVAIAGVIAMKPDVLILDEPTAGLDPRGRDEIFGEIKNLYKNGNITIIIVSHSMEDMASIANRIVVMSDGKIVMDDKAREIFKREDELVKIGLGVPQITSFLIELKKRGADINTNCITVEEAKEEVEKYLRGRENA